MVINAKGQIVIPKVFRDRFGISPGQEVEFVEEGERLILVKTGIKAKFKSMAKKYQYHFPKGVKNSVELLGAMRG